MSSEQDPAFARAGQPRRRAIPCTDALDMRRNLYPLHGRFAGDGWWLPARTPDGPGSMRVTRTKSEVAGQAWGPGARWLLDRLDLVAGLRDNFEEFDPSDQRISGLHRQNPGLRIAGSDLVFDSLVVAVCAQKVTGTEAQNAIRGLYRAFSDPAPGPKAGLRLPPDPVKMAAAPYYEYHGLHLEKRRADILRRVSAKAPEIERLRKVSPAEAAPFLADFPGVAGWSVAETLVVSHGDADQVSVGDFHLKHVVVHHMTGRDRGTDEEMLELLEPFRPHRGRVVRLLQGLGHEPRFGSRMTPRDITGC